MISRRFNQGESPGGRLPRKLAVAAFLTFGGIVVLGALSVDTYPVITNDSIAYLQHSQDLTGYGFVNVGYRQIGYPLWLAGVNWLGSLVEPLALTSLLQRLAFVAVALFALSISRGAGLMLLLLLLVPTYVAYSNLILTESIGIPLASMAGVLIVLLLSTRLAESRDRDSTDTSGPDTWLIMATAAIAVALSLVRFHYVLMAAALLAALAYAGARSPDRRRITFTAGIVAAVVIAASYFAMAVENHDEYGVWFPTARGERVEFWTVWQVVVAPNRDIVRDRLPEIYADGDPYTFMGQIDSLPYGEVRERYESAIDAILNATGTTLGNERVKAAVSSLVAGRVDDISGIMHETSTDVLPGQLEDRIHRNSFARRHGIDGFNEQFNDGRATRASLLSSAVLPSIPAPPARDLFKWLVPSSTIIILLGLVVGRLRAVSLAGLAIVVGYTGLAGWFILDNFRFLLPAYMVVAVIGGFILNELVDVARSRRKGYRQGREPENLSS